MKTNAPPILDGKTGLGLGFFLGFLLGATGFYLVGTKEGRQTKSELIESFKQFKSEYENSSNHEVKPNNISAKIQKIRSLINSALDNKSTHKENVKHNHSTDMPKSSSRKHTFKH